MIGVTLPPVGYPRFYTVCSVRQVRIDYLICKAWYNQVARSNITDDLEYIKENEKNPEEMRQDVGESIKEDIIL